MSGNLENAIENLTDEKRLIELFNMDLLASNFKRIALKNSNLVEKEDLLMEIILKESNSSLGEDAVKILIDGKDNEEKHNLLLEIINNAENFDIAYSALKLIRNRDYLKEVALNKDNHSEIRAKAVSMIVNPVFGGDVDIFLNDADWRVRRDAIHLGMEEDVLIDIAINDEDDRVRGEALKIIRNERFLHDFALNEDSLQLVFTAIKHMHNEANVRKVYDASDDELIKACARDRLDFLEAGIAIL